MRGELAAGAASENVSGGESGAGVPSKRAEGAKRDVVISHVRFKGKVKRTQSDEYVEVTNRGSAPADVSGWMLAGEAARAVFTFPAGSTIAVGRTVRVYTDEVHPESGGFSYASKRAIWNDSGDVASLSDDAGVVVSRLAYGNKLKP